MATPLLQKLAAEREHATIIPAEIDAALIDQERAAAAHLSLLERRKAQEGIDAWVKAHPEADHETTRQALNMLRSSVELLPHEDLGADVQTAIENPKGYAEKTAESLTKIVQHEVDFYKSDRPLSQKIMRAAVSAAAKLGVLWVAAKIVGWGKGGGWFGKTLRFLGLAAGSAWLVNYAARTMDSSPSAPTRAPAAIPGNLWKAGARLGAAEVREAAGKKILAVNGHAFSIVKSVGIGALAADLPLLDQLSTLTENGTNYVLNGKWVITKAELTRIIALASGQATERQDVAVTYATVASPATSQTLGVSLVRSPL